MVKIYKVQCDDRYKPYRTRILLRQGLENHPDVTMVDNPEEADYIFLNELAYKNQHFPKNKTVFIDYNDSQQMNMNIKNCLCYFKRSCAGVQNRKKYKLNLPNKVFPTTYCIMDQFIIKETFPRDIDLGCTFSESNMKKNTNRKQACEIVKNIDCTKHIGLISPDGTQGRSNYNKDYFTSLKKMKIIVTCQPDRWDGDSRTWEAFASGALVAVDKIYGLPEYPFEDRKHCIIYDTTPEGYNYLAQSIKYYLNHPKERIEVAKSGYNHAMTYHRSVNRVDYMLRIIKVMKNK